MRGVLLVVVAVGCAPHATEPIRASVRDSAGITIVENTGAAAADSVAFRVDSLSSLELGGGADPRMEFGSVRGVLLLHHRIVIADGASNEIRIFDTSGAWIRTVGRKGGGPGEFEGLGGLFLVAPDTIAAYDWNHRRLSLFTSAGDLVRERSLVGKDSFGFPTVLGILDGGDLLIQVQQLAGGTAGQSGYRRDSLRILRYARWSDHADSIARFAGTEVWQDVVSSNGLIRSSMSTQLPFGRMLTLEVQGDRFYAGTGESYQIASYDRNGALKRLVRRTLPAIAVTDADIAATKKNQLDGFRPGSETAKERVRGVLERMIFPKTKPAYDGFVVGDDGSLWVKRYDAPARNLPAHFDVFDPSGQWRGLVTFPSRFALSRAGPTYALGVWIDPDDLERIRLYHLTRDSK